MPIPQINAEATIQQTKKQLDAFWQNVPFAPYEKKGVLFSEMLFLLAAAIEAHPPRIFESGRARGVSTFWLGTIFPESEIVSIEIDPDSPDITYAAKNVSALSNVDCRFGDARQILLDEVRPADIVFIDGPKGWRAIRLVLEVLDNCKPQAIFLHDCYQGSLERHFLDRWDTGAFYSDNSTFLELVRPIDETCWEHRKQEQADEFPAPYISPIGHSGSYGPTLACIPYNKSLNYTKLLWKARITGVKNGLESSIRKRLK